MLCLPRKTNLSTGLQPASYPGKCNHRLKIGIRRRELRQRRANTSTGIADANFSMWLAFTWTLWSVCRLGIPARATALFTGCLGLALHRSTDPRRQSLRLECPRTVPSSHNDQGRQNKARGLRVSKPKFHHCHTAQDHPVSRPCEPPTSPLLVAHGKSIIKSLCNTCENNQPYVFSPPFFSEVIRQGVGIASSPCQSHEIRLVPANSRANLTSEVPLSVHRT